MNEHLLRITSYPDHDDVVLVHAHPDLADHMGDYPPARWSPGDKAYLLALEALPGLEALARHYAIPIVDQRTPSSDGPRPVPQECRHCGQPGSWTRPPAHCPGCGKDWQPTRPPSEAMIGRRDYRRCPGCGRGQTGHFEFCSACGHRLPTQPATQLKPEPRTRLDEPLPLEDSIDAVLAHAIGEEARP